MSAVERVASFVQETVRNNNENECVYVRPEGRIELLAIEITVN